MLLHVLWSESVSYDFVLVDCYIVHSSGFVFLFVWCYLACVWFFLYAYTFLWFLTGFIFVADLSKALRASQWSWDFGSLHSLVSELFSHPMLIFIIFNCIEKRFSIIHRFGTFSPSWLLLIHFVFPELVLLWLFLGLFKVYSFIIFLIIERKKLWIDDGFLALKVNVFLYGLVVVRDGYFLE